LLHLQTQSAVSPDLKGTNRKKREEEIWDDVSAGLRRYMQRSAPSVPIWTEFLVYLLNDISGGDLPDIPQQQKPLFK
jgi:hypothetical protein